ncbi:hypothetical protein ACFL2Q_20110, partial [Thermodesulfobacteriota bacterium]
PVLHHVAGDGNLASEIGRRVVLEHREIVTGIPTDWKELTHSVSTSRKRRVRIKRNRWKDFVYGTRLGLLPFTHKPTMPMGSGKRDDLRQFQIKRVLSEEETELIGKASRSRRVAFVDLVTACSNIAVDRWNDQRSISPGLVTTAMTVNMTGRYGNVDTVNRGSVIFFESKPEERQDLREFARKMSLARIKQLRRQMDLKLYENMEKGTAALRALPFEVRSRIMSRIMQKHKFSIAVTFLGTVWPVVKRGKPTGESFPTEAGEIEHSEIHGIGYKQHSGTQLVLIIYSFRNKMNFMLSASASLFTREEAEAFMDVFMEILMDSIELPPDAD